LNEESAPEKAPLFILQVRSIATAIIMATPQIISFPLASIYNCGLLYPYLLLFCILDILL